MGRPSDALKVLLLALGAVVAVVAIVVAIASPLLAAWAVADVLVEGWIRVLVAIGTIMLAVVRL